MKNRNLNILIKSSIKADKIPLSLFSLFIILSTALVMVTICVMLPFSDNLENKINNHIYNRELTLTYGANTENEEMERDLQQIKSLDYVDEIYLLPKPVYSYESSGTLKDSYNIDCLHYGYELITTSGRSFDESETGVALIPEEIKDYDATSGKVTKMNGESLIGSTLSFSYGTENSYDVTVIGTYNTADSIFSGKEILIPKNDLLEINSDMQSSLTSYSDICYQVSINSYKNMEKATEEISKIHYAEKMYMLNIDAQSYNTALIIIFAIFAVFAISIIIAIYMFLKGNINSKNSELALYRSIGYKSKHIFYIVFAEYFIAGAISLILGILITMLINKILINPYLNELVGNTLMEMTADINFLYILSLFLIFIIILLNVCFIVVRSSEKTDLTVLMREK